MHRVLTSAVVSLAVVAGVILNMQGVLSANQATPDQASVVKDGGPCGMFGADENGDVTFGGIGEITMQLENEDKVMMTCKGTDITNLSGSAQHFEGFACGILSPEGEVLVTEETHATVSASGVATMTCTYRK